MNATVVPAPHPAVCLEDYAPPPWLIDSVDLDVDIRDAGTLIHARLECARNLATEGTLPLILEGEALETREVCVDGKEWPALRITGEKEEDACGKGGACRMILENLPPSFVLQTRVRIQPDANTCLSGFYRSRNGYFTQCEPEGFRRITWFIDRPDVMARYTVTLHADKAAFPVLLSNGNLVESGDEAEGRHFAVWHDPFRKPSYLFAMVAARLDAVRDVFTTVSGKKVALAVYVEPGKSGQCAHAMNALKKAMRWDEQRFGLECDLNQYSIVAVGDFNMGAMENKGLNIFNTRYVLARADMATDSDFENIDRVVAHEYFHNWTGNRVTCRDWFQLSLKEGLTVFRDQEFGADTHGDTTARLRDVRTLRAIQFPEDAGPMAHPVRPSRYVEINNFYTATVYEKGAELVRMIQTLIGRKAFRKGMDIYFERHDGQAATCDDFVAAMSTASAFDFGPFMAWYRQAGTPRVEARGEYDSANRRYGLTLTQSFAPALGSSELVPIPVAVGLVSPDGRDTDLTNGAPGMPGESPGTRILLLAEKEQTFVFDNIPEPPIPSLLRGFSAPVNLDYPYSETELIHLLAHDSDSFNRWEAGQRLFSRLILENTARLTRNEALEWPSGVVDAARRLLREGEDPAFIAEALTLPGEATLAEKMERVDPEALYAARRGLARWLAEGLEADLRRLYARLAPTDAAYCFNAEETARRRLRNLCLACLNDLELPEYRRLAVAQFEKADNMTDRFSALAVLVNTPGEEGKQALEAFYERGKADALIVDKWLSVQAACHLPGTLARVEALSRHPEFDLKNPNRVYALFRTLGANHRHFNAQEGGGYRFLAAQIAELDSLNPQVAARLTRCFDGWKKFDHERQKHARIALTALERRGGLSKDVSEVVLRLLGKDGATA